MSHGPTRINLLDREEVVLYIGDVHASSRPVVVKTLLGSCVAACLWDPATAIGGMNHFMLPHGQGDVGEESSRFGVHAMDVLIGEIMKAGGDRRRLRAKVFGGGHVLRLPDAPDSVPRQNVGFILEFCRAEGFEVVARDLGGDTARQIRFETRTGRAWVKRLRAASGQAVEADAPNPTAAPASTYGEVILF